MKVPCTAPCTVGATRNEFPSFYSFPPVWRTAVKLQRMCVCAKSLQSYPILCDPVDYSPPGSSVHGDSPGKNTRVSCHALLQGIFPTQGSNPGLPHCMQILYHLSHQESLRILEQVACSFSRGVFPTRESNQGLLLCRQILYQLNYPGSLFPSLLIYK